MKLRVIATTLILLATTGCGSNSSPLTNSTAPRNYNGSASVGDFLNITLDPVAHSIAYTNRSNGDTGTVPYTANADGTYTLTDPNGNLVAAYEVPNYAMLIQAAKTGPTHNQPSLITAVESGQISVATWANHNYNYMQFRTSSGGLEIGTVAIDASGTATVQHYWPYGAYNGSAFN
jgi:hypothetical protein